MVASEKLQNMAMSGSESQPTAPVAAQPNVLTVRIFSFSYKTGLPKDDTGHGGGFVFDCRSVPNPGREEQFKALTGKDGPVIEFLQGQESAQRFLANVVALVDGSVAEYQRRGFNSLSISFGCTGGQHRSVYFAERLAAHLRLKRGVEVVVRHIQQELNHS